MGMLLLFGVLLNRKQLAALTARIKENWDEAKATRKQLDIAMRDQGRLLERMATLKEVTEKVKPTTENVEPPKPDPGQDA